MGRLNHKTALIASGTSGIRLAAAKPFLLEGARARWPAQAKLPWSRAVRTGRDRKAVPQNSRDRHQWRACAQKSQGPA